MPPSFQIVLLALVLAAAACDLRWRRIPNWLVLAGLIAGIGLNWFVAGDVSGLERSLLGFGLATLVYFPLYLVRAMGAGDVKLMMAVGSLAGWGYWLVIFILTGIIGGVIAVAILLIQRRFKKTAWNIGFLLHRLMQGQTPYAGNEELDVRSSKSLKLPHGFAIAIGVAIFLILGDLRGWH